MGFIPRRTTAAAQVGFLGRVLEQLQQQEHDAGTITTIAPNPPFMARSTNNSTNEGPRMLPVLDIIPVRDFLQTWLASSPEARRGDKQRRREQQQQQQLVARDCYGPWTPLKAKANAAVVNEAADYTWMRNLSVAGTSNHDKANSHHHHHHHHHNGKREKEKQEEGEVHHQKRSRITTTTTAAQAHSELSLFSRWLRASTANITDEDGNASVAVVYASASATYVPPPLPLRPTTTTTTAAFWRVLVRSLYELLRHLPRDDVFFPRREWRRLSRDAFQRFLAPGKDLSKGSSGSSSSVPVVVVEDALEAGVGILEALAGMTRSDCDAEDSHDASGSNAGKSRDAGDDDDVEDEAERRRRYLQRQHRGWRPRQPQLVLLVDLTEVADLTEQLWRTCLVRRFVEALEALVERNGAMLLLVGSDGRYRMRVSEVCR